jgi:hypothetical protein
MKQYITYRNGAKTLPERIAAALADYQVRIGDQPAALVVHPTLAADAGEVLKASGVDLPVVTTCGALAQEVWLQLSDADAARVNEV